MLEQARVAVVVPAFHEERWIAETVRRMPAFVDDVLVVDDASQDATSREAERAGRDLADLAGPAVEVIRHAKNRGVGAAIVTGYQRAREQGAAVTAVMAGDGQMHPDDLESVVLPVIRGEVDYVKGNRLLDASALRTMPLHRLAGTAALAFLTKHAAGIEALHDSQCGYTAISARALDAIDLGAIWPRYGYPNDVIGALARAGLSIGEVRVRPVYRGEASGLRPWHLGTIGYVIGRVAYRRAVDAARPRGRG